jgi:CarD family transcriptional regulator
MFNIGDQVVHKTHGAGVVTGIEEKTIDGELLKFLRVHLTLKEGDILIPLNGGVSSGLRKAVDEEGIKQLEEILGGKQQVVPKGEDGIPPDPISLIETNDPFQIAQAIRTLTDGSKSEKFEKLEKELLSGARMKLASELMLAKNLTKAAALSFINRSIHGTEKFMKAARKRRKKIAKAKEEA